MIKLYDFGSLKPEEILNRDIRAEKNVEDVVDAILADVRTRGDEALKEYALKFDGAELENLQVTQEEIEDAFANMDPYFLETLKEAAVNIESFHRQQVHKNFVVNDKPGIVLGQKYTPIEKAGDQNFQDRRRPGRGRAGLRHPDHPGGGQDRGPRQHLRCHRQAESLRQGGH